MPPKKRERRIIAGPRDTSWDNFIAQLVTERGYGHEREYVGITTEDRADEVRRKLRTAGRHQGVSVKAFWRPCNGCEHGGPDCAYHVHYTAYHPDAARRYKGQQAGKITPRRRPGRR
jgi:hypothetical protein